MKIAVLMALLVFSVPFLHAAGLETWKKSYAKGETITVSGECGSGTRGSISAAEGLNAVFEEEVECANGRFEFSYETGFLDPSGTWLITALQGNSRAEIEVTPVPESSYYKITLLKPAILSLERGSRMIFRVLVEDGGIPLQGVEVLLYGIGGGKIPLDDEGGGAYSKELEIPLDARLGKWEAVVTSRHDDAGRVLGGERAFGIEIGMARIEVEILEPSAQFYGQGEGVPVLVKAAYADGTALGKDALAEISSSLGGERIALEARESGLEFSGTHAAIDEGSASVVVTLQDVYGNASEAEKGLFVSCGALCALKKWSIPLALLAIAGLFGTLVLRPVMRRAGGKEKVKRAEAGIERLQKDYFSGAVGREEYTKSMAEYKGKLIEAEQGLGELKGRQKKAPRKAN